MIPLPPPEGALRCTLVAWERLKGLLRVPGHAALGGDELPLLGRLHREELGEGELARLFLCIRKALRSARAAIIAPQAPPKPGHLPGAAVRALLWPVGHSGSDQPAATVPEQSAGATAIMGWCADCRGERSLACVTCEGAGVSEGDEGGTYACTVCGGTGHVRCLSCDGGRAEPTFGQGWGRDGEVQSPT